MRLRPAVLGVLCSGMLAAQTDLSHGEIRGVITDPSAGLLPRVTVSMRSVATGLSRATTSDDSGEYAFIVVPPGAYDLEFTRPEFQTAVVRDVRVSIGQITTVSASLNLGIILEKLTVTSDAPLIERDRTHQSSVMSQEQIRGLPIDRRDYLSFALLSPGILDANAQANNTDLRLKQTPSSGISFFGSNGRGNSVTIDGGEANDGGGGVRSTLSQEAIEEFQINRSNYTAEFGGASGGTINIVSKSGTNQWHGSVFGFFRHHSLDARNPFARVLNNGSLVGIKPPAHRQQFGASIGGPLRRDRTFLFSAFEGLVRRESSVVSILTDTSIFGPTPAQAAFLATLPTPQAAALRAALTASPATRELFEKNSGVFPFRTDSWRFSTRLDHLLTPSDQLFLRASYSDLDESNANLQALIGASRGLETKQFDPTVTAGWTRVIRPPLVNQFQTQWAYRRFDVDSIEKFGPELRINGFGVFNQDYLLPTRTIERRLEVKDDLTWDLGRHRIKAGGRALVRGTHTESHIFFTGRFTFGELPGSVLDPAFPSTFTLNSLQSFNLGLAQTYLQGAGDPVVASTNPFWAAYLQDTWKAAPGLTLDFGVRYELDQRQRPLPTTRTNIAPRFGLAWAVGSNQRTVVRAGYGIYFSPIYYQIDWSVNALNDFSGRRQIGQAFTSILVPGPAAANNIYSTLVRQGVIGVPTPVRSINASDVAQFGVSFSRSGPLSPFAILFENSPDFTNPYAQQASASVERQIGQDLSVSVGFTWVRTLKLTRSRDANLLPAPVDPQLGIRVWSDPAYFVDPLIAQRNVFESTANADYAGLILEVTRRFGRGFSFHANYTLSSTKDDVVDYNSDFQAADQADLRAERAYSSFHQRHKFVAWAIWQGPAKVNLAPILRINSGRPFNLLAGVDINQDRHDATDRPIGAGRNTGRGPGFFSVDLRLAREFALSEAYRVELIAESFNLLNRLNFASVNNVVGLLAPPFNVTGRHDRIPTEPLGFTSAFEPRRFQIGIRLRF